MWALVQSDWCPYRKRTCGHKKSLQGCARSEKRPCEGAEEGSVCKPRREAQGNEPTRTLSRTPSLQTVRKSVSLKPESVVSYVVAEQTNTVGDHNSPTLTQ